MNIKQNILLFGLIFSTMNIFAENPASVSFSESFGEKQWVVENDVLRLSFKHNTNGAILPESFYNIEAAVEYLRPSGNQLFNLTGQFIPVNENEKFQNVENFALRSVDEQWIYKKHSIENILISSAIPQIIGKKLSVIFEKEEVEITLNFEIFDGRAGLRYQALIKNRKSTAKMLIERSDVIALNIQNRQHNLHYITNIDWLSTTSTIEEATMYAKGKNVAKCAICLFNTNEGWYMAPEVNWKTQYGPEIPEDSGYEYQHRSFAGLTAWAGGSSTVKVSTYPEALQLILFPNESFEYIAVNLTTFKGDIVDAKMAVEEHLRKRFRFHNTSTTYVVNDWDWFTQGYRNENFYLNVVVPQAKRAGYEMIMFDDGWNNLNSAGNGLDNNGNKRDNLEADSRVTTDMRSFTQKIADSGLLFGLWYSMSGGNHNRGNDLALKSVIETKKGMIRYMLENYHLVHQAVDLTEYWQNLAETSDSHPSDNVYRKAVLTRNMVNELVDEFPQYVVKVTSELDIYPSQGDRNVDLIHIPNNGWFTTTGAPSNAGNAAIIFGHLPLSAGYVGGGNPTGQMVDYYAAMSARNVKVTTRPNTWDENGISLMSKFNGWRHGNRIQNLTDGIIRPVYFGENWDNKDANLWNIGKGPYLWMFCNDEKTEALLVGTTSGGDMGIGKFYPIRWLDDIKTYLIQDITLDDNGTFTYNFKGKYSGESLKNQGLQIHFFENTSGGKAYWLKADNGQEKQVIYADEKVLTYNENLSGNQLILTATGTPDSTGKIVVYGKSENDAMIVNIPFDNNGNASVTITSIENNDISYPGGASDIQYQMKDYHDGLIKSNEQIFITEVDNGLGRSDKSSYVSFTALDDYVIYKLSVPFSGNCKISVNYKISKSSRGNAQLYFVDGSNEQILGSSFNQSTSGNEEMRTLNLGTVHVDAPGEIGLKMKLVGLGVSGNGKVLSLNYITISK